MPGNPLSEFQQSDLGHLSVNLHAAAGTDADNNMLASRLFRLGRDADSQLGFASHLGCLHVSMRCSLADPKKQVALLRAIVSSLAEREEYAITANLSGQLLSISKQKGDKRPVATWGNAEVPQVTSAYLSSQDTSHICLEGTWLQDAEVWTFCAGVQSIERLERVPQSSAAEPGKWQTYLTTAGISDNLNLDKFYLSELHFKGSQLHLDCLSCGAYVMAVGKPWLCPE